MPRPIRRPSAGIRSQTPSIRQRISNRLRRITPLSRIDPSPARQEKTARFIGADAYVHFDDSERALMYHMASNRVDNYALHIAVRQALDRYGIHENRGEIGTLFEKMNNRLNQRIVSRAVQRPQDAVRDVQQKQWGTRLESLLGKKASNVFSFALKNQVRLKRQMEPIAFDEIESNYRGEEAMRQLFKYLPKPPKK